MALIFYEQKAHCACTAEHGVMRSSMKLISRVVTSDIGYQLIGDSTNLLQSDRSEEECKYVLMTSDYEHDEHDDDYEESYAIRTNMSSVHTRYVFACNCMFCFVRTEVNLAQTLSVPQIS